MNSIQHWTATESVAETISHHDLLGEYGIGFKYLKIAENEYPAEQLLTIQNIVSTLFLAENHYDLDKLQDALLDLFEKEERHALSLFLNWFRMLAMSMPVIWLDWEKCMNLSRFSNKRSKTYPQVRSYLNSSGISMFQPVKPMPVSKVPKENLATMLSVMANRILTATMSDRLALSI